MKKIIFPAVVILLASCSSKETSKWNAASISKICLEDISKGKASVSTEQIKVNQEICDCVGQKTVEKYKTEQAAKEKIADATAISNECQEEWMKNKKESYGK